MTTNATAAAGAAAAQQSQDTATARRADQDQSQGQPNRQGKDPQPQAPGTQEAQQPQPQAQQAQPQAPEQAQPQPQQAQGQQAQTQPQAGNAQQAPVNAGKPKPDQGLTAGRFILEQLAAWGVRRIYGVIGDAVLYLFDDIAKQDKIQYIPFLHENAAALAAAAEAKLTGRVAVVAGSGGPGLANMLNGLGDAWADGARVLAITGQVDAPHMGARVKQYVQHQLAVQPFAAVSETAAHPDALPEILARCLAVCTARGTVVHLSVPKDLFRQPVKGTVTPYSPHWHQPLLPPLKEVEEVFRMLASAARPMLVVGRGCEGVERETLALAEAVGAAVAATLPARHLFPNGHEWYVGGIGQAGSEAASAALAESDLVLVCGATWWPEEFAPPDARVVQIDAVREHIGIGMPLARGLVGDLRAIMPQLAALAAAQPRDPKMTEAWRKRVGELRTAWAKRLRDEMKPQAAPDGIPRDAPPGTAPHPVSVPNHGMWDPAQTPQTPQTAAAAPASAHGTTAMLGMMPVSVKAPSPGGTPSPGDAPAPGTAWTPSLASAPGAAPPPVPSPGSRPSSASGANVPPGTAPPPVPKPRLSPQRLMKLLSEAIPREAVVALDTGDHTLWWGRCFENRGQRVLLSGMWRAIGCALPAAIAAGLVFPGRPVVAVAGDGGATQTIIELKTAANLGLPVTLIVINNDAYALEMNRMRGAGLQTLGAVLRNPDFADLAKALGADGLRADEESEFREALEKAFRKDRPQRPMLIEVAVSPDAVPHTSL